MTTSTSTQTTKRARARTSSALAVGGLVTALALAACGTEVANGSGEGLAPLRIGSASGNGAPAAGSDSSGGKLASGWTLQGSLPAGPGSGPVLRFTGAPGEDDVRALAAALGLTAAPGKRAHGWVVDGKAGQLRVRNDASGQWSFSRSSDCPSYFVDVDRTDGSTGVSCAVADAPASVTVPLPPDAPSDAPTANDLPLVTDDAALATAEPVLAAAGVDATPRVRGGAGGQSGTVASVVADPTISGLPTSGLSSVVDVDGQGVVGATGWLGDLTADGDYPVLSAQKAFDRLDSMPRPLAAIACPDIAPGPMESGAPETMPCASPEPMVITGATFGLTLSWEGLTPILVPAWLFAVTGWDTPLAQIAVADQYLADPTPIPEPTTGTGGGSDPGSGGSAIPPQPGTPDTPVEPPTDRGLSPEPAPGYVSIVSAIASADGMSLTLVGWGGVCAEYSGEVKEDPAHVYGYVTSRSTLAPDEACIEIAKEIKVTVKLQEPLGSRTVIDQTSNSERVVPVEKS